MPAHFAGMERFGVCVPQALREPWRHHLLYTTFYRWPQSPEERVASMVIVHRVTELCRALGAAAFLVLPDAVGPDELQVAEMERRTHTVDVTDPDRIFAD